MNKIEKKFGESILDAAKRELGEQYDEWEDAYDREAMRHKNRSYSALKAVAWSVVCVIVGVVIGALAF